MNKTIATLIDELTITNIKIYHLREKMRKNKHNREELKKLQDLNKYHSQLHRGLNKQKPIKKTLAALIDELTVTNIKIFVLVDKVLKNEHTKEDAKKAQDLNRYRSRLCNAISKEFKEREDIKV